MTTKTQTEKRGSDVKTRLTDHTLACFNIAVHLIRSPHASHRGGCFISSDLAETAKNALLRHAEAEGSPSAKEFADKFRLALVQLRLNRTILDLIYNGKMSSDPTAVASALEDVDILIRIFFSSIRTLENRAAA